MMTVVGELRYVTKYMQLILECDTQTEQKIREISPRSVYEYTNDEGETQTNVKLSLVKYLKQDEIMMEVEDLVGKKIECVVQVRRWVGKDDGEGQVALICRRFKKV